MSHRPVSMTASTQGPMADPVSGPAAATELQRCCDTLERLTCLTATWKGLDPTLIAGSVLDALLEMLALDFVGLRFGESTHLFSRTRATEHGGHDPDGIRVELGPWFGEEPGRWPTIVPLAGEPLRVLALPLGTISDTGLLVAVARRAEFPSQADRLVLRIAAIQVGSAFREIREVADRTRPIDHRPEPPTGAALAESESRLNLIINSIPAMAWSATVDGLVDFANQNFLDFIGGPYDEVGGLNFYRIFHPDDMAHLLAEWQDIMSSVHPREVEGRIRRADGHYRWCVLRQKPLIDADGSVVKWYGVVLDIEDRKVAEQGLSDAKAALLASEQNLSLIINSLPVLVWSARPDGSADFVNQSWLDYAGLPAEKILEWGFLDLYHPDDVEGMVELWKDSLEHSDRTLIKGRIRGADGAYRWFYFAGRRLTDANGVVRWYGVNVDIEDLQRADEQLRTSEAALKASERQLKLVVNTIPAMAWSALPDGMLDYWSQNLTDFVGLPSDEIVGLGFYQIFHPDDLEAMRTAWEEIIRTKRALPVDARIRRSDGEYRWFALQQSPLLDADGSVLRWYGVIVDIEDRKRAETALEETKSALLASEGRLQHLINLVPGLIWSADGDGTVTYLSQQYLEYVGLDRDLALAGAWITALHPDDIERLVGAWTDALGAGQAREAEARLRHIDGRYRWFLFRASPFYDSTGHLSHWFGINIDIEDRRRAEAELRRSESDLAHVTRLLTMDELAVSIAHEVNQPLMAIVTNASTCLRWLDETQLDLALARQAAARVVRDGHRAGDIITSIRALARKSPPLMERTDLEQVSQGVLELLRGELQRRDILVKTDFSPGAKTILGDGTLLQQVILNLIMNSAEAMAAIPPARRRLVVRTHTRDGMAQVDVADTGAGLDAVDINRLFEAFFTTKSEGIGMGLSICRSILEAHGGHIWASNDAPRGSVFSFAIPLAAGVGQNVG
ncbi:PAS domain-containing sensor histidine kinase [Sphingomonas sp. 22R3R2A-7]|uniref:PAS domain-containing sensor histidine kinase n=1 Tax=Sphingomonas sp. 22R3R2A-7 TaxID=3050230 RepID=UPI002FE16D73